VVVDGTKRYLYKFKSTTERDDWHDVLNKQSAKCTAGAHAHARTHTTRVARDTPKLNLSLFDGRAGKAEPASAVPELEIAVRTDIYFLVAHTDADLINAPYTGPRAVLAKQPARFQPGIKYCFRCCVWCVRVCVWCVVCVCVCVCVALDTSR
jgi:hypothetical protein